MEGRATGLVLAILATAAGVAGQSYHRQALQKKLGKVSFATSCKPSVQERFERGVALLHSFAYSAAEQQFAEVSQADPDCAMAHWGTAMSYYRQLWEPRIAASDLARGALEIRKAQGLGNVSEREAGFIRALESFYRDAASLPQAEREQAYLEGMKRVAEGEKGDAEAQAFYALALLSTASSTDPGQRNQRAAAAILQPLVSAYPEHPGVAHYLIHACDSPEMARTGLPAARAYAKIAPAAPHALHMPSHIFTLLGLWEDSIRSNQAARRAAHEQDDVGEELHAMDYLEYAYLQAADYSSARKLSRELHAIAALDRRDFKIGYAATAIPARYAVERRDWAGAAALSVHQESLPQVTAIAYWGRAIGLARGGNPGAAEREVAQLARCLEKVRAQVDDYWAAQVEIQIAEANAWILGAKGQGVQALKLMRLAADKEDQLLKRPITPGAIVPAREQLGDLLLELEQPGPALNEFETALATAPGRRGALAGASKAAELAGNDSKARQYKAQLCSPGF